MSGNTEVLAGEASGEEVNRNGACVNPPVFARDGATGICLSSRRWFDTDISYVGEHSGSGPMLGKHPSSPFVGLAEEGVLPSGEVEAVVESADPGEQAAGSHVTRATVPLRA